MFFPLELAGAPVHKGNVRYRRYAIMRPDGPSAEPRLAHWPQAERPAAQPPCRRAQLPSQPLQQDASHRVLVGATGTSAPMCTMQTGTVGAGEIAIFTGGPGCKHAASMHT